VFDQLNSVVRKFYAGKFFLDQYQQLQLVEGIKVKIVSEVRLICNSFGIKPKYLAMSARILLASKSTCGFLRFFPPHNTPRL